MSEVKSARSMPDYEVYVGHKVFEDGNFRVTDMVELSVLKRQQEITRQLAEESNRLFDEKAALQQKLDAAEAKLISVTESRDQWEANAHEFSRCADRLEAKLAELEKQEPIGMVVGKLGAGLRVQCYFMPDSVSLGHELFTRPAPAVPDGWQLVPVEMTKEMWLQAHTLCDATCPDCGKGFAVDVTENVRLSWGDMLAAAQEKPQ